MGHLPTGIVTFLFTDIEGHTRLLERLGERYEAIKLPHDAIVQAIPSSRCFRRRLPPSELQRQFSMSWRQPSGPTARSSASG